MVTGPLPSGVIEFHRATLESLEENSYDIMIAWTLACVLKALPPETIHRESGM